MIPFTILCLSVLDCYHRPFAPFEELLFLLAQMMSIDDFKYFEYINLSLLFFYWFSPV
jgi:hypothetical protein